MPSSPLRLTTTGALVRGRVRHTGGPHRGTPSARGYDDAWIRLRDRHRAAHPLCVRCWARGIVRAVHDVDHIVPFTSLRDPRRLDPRNLQSLCADCHRDKTRDDKRQTKG